jgi:hypothetical protein
MNFNQSSCLARHKLIHKGNTAANLNRRKGFNEDSSTIQNSSNDCIEGEEVQSIKEEMNENKAEDLFDYDRIDIEEFKIEPDNNIDEERSLRSTLSQHNRNDADIERINDSSSLISPKNFVDCGEPIKVEYIKEEINEEESVADPLLLKHNNESEGSDLKDT